MTPRRTALLLAMTLLAAPLAHAEDPRPAEPTGDLKTMQGEWVSKDDSGESTWTITGDKLHLVAPGREYRIVLKLDEKATPHKTIDMDVQDDSPNAAGTKGLCIYKFDGDKLTICFGGETRPTEFVNSFPTSFLFELQRKKKDG
jgi:uncharacterized protein (TIGR03067 family)